MARIYIHHNKEQKSHYLSFNIGSIEDGLNRLKQLCNDKSVELLKTIELNEDNKDVYLQQSIKIQTKTMDCD